MFCTKSRTILTANFSARQLRHYDIRPTIFSMTENNRKSSRLIATMIRAGRSNRFYASDSTAGDGVNVQHDQQCCEFYVDMNDKGRARLEYERKDQLMKIMHTEVPQALEGRGLGRILAKEALEYVANNNLNVEIHCDFVRHFVTKYEPKYIRYLQN